MGRDILYDTRQQGKMPNLSAVLGAEGGKLPNAYFEDRALSALPSSTMAA